MQNARAVKPERATIPFDEFARDLAHERRGFRREGFKPLLPLAIIVVNLPVARPGQKRQVVLDAMTEVTTNRRSVEIGYRLTEQAVVQAIKERHGLLQIMEVRSDQAFHVRRI